MHIKKSYVYPLQVDLDINGQIFKKKHLSNIKKMACDTVWLDNEIDYLIKNYSHLHHTDLCTYLNRSRQVITTKANKLGLKKSKPAVCRSRGEQRNGKSWENHTDAHKKHMSFLMKDRIRRGEHILPKCVIGCKNSKLEKRFENILHSLNYIEHTHFKKHLKLNTEKTSRYPDFVFVEKKLIFEVDGEYWHQDKQKEKNRDLELNDIGYTVVHFTGSQICGKETWVKENIMMYLTEMN